MPEPWLHGALPAFADGSSLTTVQRSPGGGVGLDLAAYDALIADVPELVWWRLLGVRYVLTKRDIQHGALTELDRKNVVTLDPERKASMVSNLLVVLCSENNVQPVVNTGTLYQ